MRLPLDPRSRLLQLFITENPPGVCEVGAIDVDNKTARLRCTCETWTWETPCAHHLYVVGRMERGDNLVYPAEILGKIDPNELARATTDLTAYRDFILMRTKIEVLDA